MTGQKIEQLFFFNILFIAYITMYPMSIELRFNCVRWRAHVDHFTFLLERIKTPLIGQKTEHNEKHISRTVTLFPNKIYGEWISIALKYCECSSHGTILQVEYNEHFPVSTLSSTGQHSLLNLHQFKSSKIQSAKTQSRAKACQRCCMLKECRGGVSSVSLFSDSIFCSVGVLNPSTK